MPGPFDTTTKFLVQTYPRDWLAYLGLATPEAVDVIDADLSTVTAAADKVIRLSEPEPWLVHVVTFTLLGLRFPPELARQVLPGIRNMRESSTYQAILDEGRAEGEVRGRAKGRVEGRVEEARQMLIRLGTVRLGPPDTQAHAVLAALTDAEHVERLGERLFSVTTWQELLTPPNPDPGT